jgi:catechol-2,3-dioxygenase
MRAGAASPHSYPALFGDYMKRRVLHIAEVGLRVKDLLNMVNFYQEVLGFEVEISQPHHVFMKVGE